MNISYYPPISKGYVLHTLEFVKKSSSILYPQKKKEARVLPRTSLFSVLQINEICTSVGPPCGTTSIWVTAMDDYEVVECGE